MRPVLAFAIMTLFSTNTALAAAVGVTRQAHEQVSGTLSGKQRVIVTSAEVFENERLISNANGNAQIELLDGTKIVVGPDANVVLDKFVYNADNSINSLTVKATKGAFRFISGKSDHAAYKVVTPTATIGIRGTAFDVTVSKAGSHIALLSGGVTVCTPKGECRNIDQRCDYVFVGNGSFSKERNIADRPKQKSGDIFPLLANQSKLLSSFRLNGRSCGVAANSTASAQTAAAAPSAAPAAPASAPPSTPNRSGLGDGTNPGKGSGQVNSNNNGNNNPGG